MLVNGQERKLKQTPVSTLTQYQPGLGCSGHKVSGFKQIPDLEQAGSVTREWWEGTAVNGVLCHSSLHSSRSPQRREFTASIPVSTHTPEQQPYMLSDRLDCVEQASALERDSWSAAAAAWRWEAVRTWWWC